MYVSHPRLDVIDQLPKMTHARAMCKKSIANQQSVSLTTLSSRSRTVDVDATVAAGQRRVVLEPASFRRRRHRRSVQ